MLANMQPGKPAALVGQAEAFLKNRLTPGFYKALGHLETYSVADTLAKEVVGINLPKIFFTRTNDERMDVAVSEIGNTAAFATGGLLVNKALEMLYKTASQGSQNPALAKQWATLGRSLGLYSTIFSLMWVMPFVRNYVTTKRIGSDRFTDVIGAQPVGLAPQAKGNPQSSLDAYKQKIATILGLGASGTLLSGLIGYLGIRSTHKPGHEMGKALPKLLGEQSLYSWLKDKSRIAAGLQKAPMLDRFLQGSLGRFHLKNLLLEGGSFSKFAGLPALLFWGVPAYLGWIHASRDTYERKEQVLKFGNFVACFLGPSVLLGKLFRRKLQPLLGNQAISYANIQKIADPLIRNKALSLWARQTGLSLGSSILLLGTMPQLINIYLTNRRLKHARLSASSQAFLATPPTMSALRRKNWDEWGHNAASRFPVGVSNAPSPFQAQATRVTSTQR